MSALRLKLPALRAERRLSQRQLAALVGIRPDTISALERGETAGIRFETLARLCDALSCEPGDIFQLESTAQQLPVLGGPDEDDLVRRRLNEAGSRIDGASFLAELTAGSRLTH